jgi:hypothetical protein
MTVVPDVPLGTAKVQLKPPVPSVVNEPPPGQVVMVTPSKTSDASADDTENPVPDTVTVAPNGPWSGITVIEGVVMVNSAVAVSDPPSLPVTTTLYGTLLPASEGTENVQEKVPVPDVV